MRAHYRNGFAPNLQCFLQINRNITVVKPGHHRHLPNGKLDCACQRDCVPTGSHTSPLSGNQSWTVPITTTFYRGRAYDFHLTYNSHGHYDPQAPETPNFAGLSQKNSKWTHNYAQWIDFYEDQATGERYAVWHRDGGQVAFKETGTEGEFISPQSNLQLGALGPGATSPPFTCNGGAPQTLQLPYNGFTIVDGSGTRYWFNYLPPTGQTHLDRR